LSQGTPRRNLAQSSLAEAAIMKLPTYPDYKKQHDDLEKTVKARKAALEKQLSEIDDAKEAIIGLYRKFDKIAKSIAKETKTEDDDKKAVLEIKALLKDGDGQIKGMEKALKDIDAATRDVPKLRKEAQNLVKDLEIQAKMLAKTKAPDASKYDALMRDARRTDGVIESDLIKHRGDGVDPAKDRKDFEKELNKFIDLIVAGKHRKVEDEDAWMTGLLTPKKVLETDRRLKSSMKTALGAIKDIYDAITAGKKSGELADMAGNHEAIKKTLEFVDKLKKSYARQFKLTPPADLKEYFRTPDGKKLAALRKEMDDELADLQRLQRKAIQDTVVAMKEIDKAKEKAQKDEREREEKAEKDKKKAAKEKAT
jgi:hypothetical protein